MFKKMKIIKKKMKFNNNKLKNQMMMKIYYE